MNDVDDKTLRTAAPSDIAADARIQGVHTLIAVVADAFPERIAVVHGDDRLSYRELDRNARRVARHLTTLGVQRGSVVVVCLDRSPRSVAATLGVLKAGAAYLPIDPSTPGERAGFVVADSAAVAVVVDGALRPSWIPEGVRVVLLDDALSAGTTGDDDHGGGCVTAATDLAYVIYTSGSTGTPKGVEVEHGSLLNLLSAMSTVPGLTSADAVLSVVSPAFDVAVLDTWWPLSIGARLVLVDHDVAFDGRLLADELERSEATLMQAAPSIWRLLIDADWVPGRPFVAVSGGEPLKARLASLLIERGAAVWNAYGPTETTVCATLHRVTPGEAVIPIGSPIAGVSVTVLDDHGQPASVGTNGELCIGGAGVARGYRRHPELDADRFVADPFSGTDGARMYRTGDIVRRRNDGDLEFVGRSDEQVKLRGNRIELTEIEAVLDQHNGVKASVVTVDRRVDDDDDDDDDRLVAHFVAIETGAMAAAELRHYLLERLPVYMVPSRFVELDTLPLLPSGKVDRRCVRELAVPPVPAESNLDVTSDGGTAESRLLAIWRSVLQVHDVGVDESFFDHGGHSLLATKIVSRIRHDFGLELPVRTVYEAPTVARMAAEITKLRGIRLPDGHDGITSVDRTQPLRLSHSQERMWFLFQLYPKSAAYNIAGALRLRGPIDVEALRWSLNAVVARHESLRTRFDSVDGIPMRTIEPFRELDIPVVDLHTFDLADREQRLKDMLTADAREPFDLNVLPLMRFMVCVLGDDDHVLYFNMHHIVSDQWSFGVFSDDLSALYRAKTQDEDADLAPMTVQEADYTGWHRRWLDSGALDAQLDYWRRQLDGLPVVDLPADRARPAIQSTNGGEISVPFPADIAAQVEALSYAEQASPFMVMLAALDLLMARYTGSEDVVVGTAIANRNFLESERIISSLVNTLVLRSDLSGTPTFRQIVRRVHGVALDAYANQDVPFAQLVTDLQPTRDLSRSAFFQVFFNVQNAPFDLPKLGESSVELLMVDRAATQFDLSLSVDTTITNRAVLHYNTDLFDVDRIERFIDHYWNLLRAATSEPDRLAAELPMLSGGELDELRADWTSTSVPLTGEFAVHGLVENQTLRTPDRPAVTFGDRTLSYSELNARSNRLARHLRASGVERGDYVGVQLDRSEQMIVAVLAVMKAGAAYIPLDPGFPAERLEYMIADAGVRVIVTVRPLAPGAGREGVLHICLDEDDESIGRGESADLGTEIGGDDLAYVIYTSGSTGRPKGVQLEHRSVVNFLQAMGKRPGLTAGDVLLSVTTLSFDISVLEILLPLTTGAQVVIASRETAINARALQAALSTSAATVMQATPTTWRLLVESGWEGNQRLKILCGGETMPRELADQLLPRCAELWNMYGPTETTVWSSVHRVGPSDRPVVPIGRPIDNTVMYILDSRLQLLPVGVPGELYIGGAGLARGYLGRLDLTAERFIADPFAPDLTSPDGDDRRMYRTGDIARRLASGDFEFLGRADTQVKVRGYRIELAEIETVLSKHAAVSEAVVVAHEFGSGDYRLIAYLIPNAGYTIEAAEMRLFLQTILPDYMVPVGFVGVDAFPLTLNNKVDRAALPRPDGLDVSPSSEPPRPGLETQIAVIWEHVLGISGLGRDDDFFQVGGHSLLAIRVFAHVEALTGKQFPLVTLFSAPTVARFAELLRAGGVGESHWTSLVALQPFGQRQPFFYVAPFLISVLSFAHLSTHLGVDQPFYALQPQGLEDANPPHHRIEDMAAHYISEIKHVQPTGPYAIGGHCAGSWVAFEMARQLQKQGDEVNVLILVDSEPPNVDPPRMKPLRYVVARAKHYGQDARLFDAVRWRLRLLAQRSVARRVGPEKSRRLAEVRQIHAVAHRRYRSGGMFNGDATFIRSVESSQLADKDWHLRWDQLITGHLHVELVAGTHAALVENKNSQELAKRIRAALDIAGDNGLS